MSDTVTLKVPEKFRRDGYKKDEHKSIESGPYLIELMCEKPGTAGGYAFIDSFSALLTGEDMKRGLKGPPDFIDMYPEKPLHRAVYSRENAIPLVEGTGWEIESFHEPEEHIQHSIICKPS
jgi:hypothetical protein